MFLDKEKYGILTIHVGGEEETKDGRLHHHAYIRSKKPLSLKAWKTFVGQEHCHIESVRGPVSKYIEYCDKPRTKTGSAIPFAKWGDPPTQGKRSDILALRTHYREGGDLKAAVEDDDLCAVALRHPHACEKLRRIYQPVRTSMTELYIYWGPTGTGKSHLAYEDGLAIGEVYHKPTGPWWDGYRGQPVVIFDDFRGECSLAEMLRLCDKYPHQVPVKGGFEQFTSTRIYLTSNLSPDEFWNAEQKGYDPSYAALRRRITNCTHFTEPFKNN
jgi:hypothetical protein